jgi:hypothetical protein
MRFIRLGVVILVVGGVLAVLSCMYVRATYSLVSVGGFWGENVAPASIVDRGYPIAYLEYSNRLDGSCLSQAGINLDLSSIAKNCKKTKIVSSTRDITFGVFIEDWAIYSLAVTVVFLFARFLRTRL